MVPEQPIIVYVEDDEQDIHIMKMIMERVMKWKSLHVLHNNTDFLQQIRNLGVIPDLFLLDINMKPYNRYELLATLRNERLFDNSRVVALTAGILTEQVLRLQVNGFDGVISKPLHMDVFPKLIMHILNGQSVWHIR